MEPPAPFGGRPSTAHPAPVPRFLWTERAPVLCVAPSLPCFSFPTPLEAVLPLESRGRCNAVYKTQPKQLEQ